MIQNITICVCVFVLVLNVAVENDVAVRKMAVAPEVVVSVKVVDMRFYPR